MATEELKIKISVDTSELDPKITQAKKKLKDLSDTTAKSVKGATVSVEELQSTMEQMRNLDFLSFISKQLEGVKSQLDGAKQVTQLFSKTAKDSFSHAGQMFREAWKDITDMPNDNTYTSISGFIETFKVSVSEAVPHIKSGFEDIGIAFRATGKAINASLTPILTKLALFTAAVATAANVVNTFRTAIGMKELYYAAGSLGLSVSQYQEWAYVFESVGESADGLADAIKTLSSEQAILAEGSDGNKAAFQALGLSVAEVTKMSQEDLFRETITRLQKVEDSVQRTTLAYQIFGEDTAARLTNVIQLNNEELEKLSENFYLLGGGASGTLIQKSTQLAQVLQNLRIAWQGLTRTLAELFMPAIKVVVEWLTKALVIVNLFLKTIFGLDIAPAASGIDSVSSSMDAVAGTASDATKEVEKLKKVTMGFDELNIIPSQESDTKKPNADSTGKTNLGDGNVLGLSDSAFAKAQKKIEEFQKKIEDFFNKWKTEIQIIAAALAGLGMAKILGDLGKAIGLSDTFLSKIDGIKKLASAAITLTLQYSLVNDFFDKYIDGEGIKNYILGVLTAALGTGILYAMWGPAGLVIGLGVTAAAAFKAVWDNGGITNIESLVVALTGVASAVGAIVSAIKLLKPAIAGSNFGAFIALLKEGNSLGSVLAVTFPKLAGAVKAVASGLTALGGGSLGVGLAIVAGIIAAIASAIYFMKKNWDAVTESVKKFFETNIEPKLQGLKQSWEDIKAALASLIPEGLLEWFQDVGDAIADLTKKMGEWLASIEWLEAIGAVFEWLGFIVYGAVMGVIMGAIDAFVGWIESLGRTFEGLIEIVAGVINHMIGLFTGDLDQARLGLEQILNGIVALFEGLVGLVFKPVEDLVNGVIDYFGDLWESLLNSESDSSVSKGVKAIDKWFKDTKESVTKTVKEWTSSIGKFFKDMWNGIVSWFKSSVAPKFTKEYWSNKFNTIKQGASEKLTGLKNEFTKIWGSITDWFSKNVAPKFTFKYWYDKFDNITGGAMSALGDLLGGVTDIVSDIMDVLSGIGSKVTGAISTVGGWLTGNSSGYSMRSAGVPQMATGGIVTRSIFANIGENGAEAVLPLENNTQWMDRLADRIAARNSAPTKIVLKVGERELGQATIKSINQITKQTGGLQLQLV